MLKGFYSSVIYLEKKLPKKNMHWICAYVQDARRMPCLWESHRVPKDEAQVGEWGTQWGGWDDHLCRGQQGAEQVENIAIMSCKF